MMSGVMSGVCASTFGASERCNSMRLNRGVMILGIVATLVTLVNVYFSLIIDALLCFDSCSDVGSQIASGDTRGLLSLLLPLLTLFPSAVLIVVAWAWEINEAQRFSARRLLSAVISFPAVSLIAAIAVAFLTSISERGLVMYPINIGYGSFMLALWPLLITLTAIFWQRSTSTSAPMPGPAAN